MILPVEHFYTITHFKHILLIHIAYAQELMGAAKEALQRSFPVQHTVSLAGKWANILQYIVPTTFENSNYFCQRGLHPLRLVQKI